MSSQGGVHIQPVNLLKSVPITLMKHHFCHWYSLLSATEIKTLYFKTDMAQTVKQTNFSLCSFFFDDKQKEW